MSCENEREYARLQIKYTSISGSSPTLPLTQDHNDGTWSPTDLYVGEFFLNASDDKLWVRTFNGIMPVGGTTSGTSSFIGDFVSKTNGGTYSGTVSVPTLIANTVNATDVNATTFTGTDITATTFYGDGSQLTGITATLLGGTVSGTASFSSPVYFETETWLDGPIRNSFGEVTFADNISTYGSVTANTFIGDGSQLTGISYPSYTDTYTTNAYLDGTVVRFDRTDAANAYSVDLTPIIGSYLPQSFNWDGPTNTMTVYLVDGSFLTMTLDTFDSLSVTNGITANEVTATTMTANTFYGTFIGDLIGGMTGSTGPAGPVGATGHNGAPGTNGFLIVNSTWSNFITRYGAGTLTKGARYKINDLSGDNIGPFSIWIDALDTNKVSNYAILEMTIINPSVYTSVSGGLLGVWSEYGCGYSLASPGIGDICIWGGYLWENTTGYLGSFFNTLNLDSNWSRISTGEERTGSSHYFKKRFNIELNFQQYTSFQDWNENMIVSIKDDNGNTVYRDDSYSVAWKVTDWGDYKIVNNTSFGIMNNICSSIRDNKAVGIIRYNQYDVIERNDIMSIRDNYGEVAGGISDNHGGIIGGNKVLGLIRGNRQPKDSTLSDNGDLTWTNNIEYNMCNDIVSNAPVGSISYNNITNVISDNTNTGDIYFNTNNGSITGNAPSVTTIMYNSNNGGIQSNSNTGLIGYNKNDGDVAENYSDVTDISTNSNGGAIYRNSNTGSIANNSTNGVIMYNSNAGNIQYNSNNGDLSYNYNPTTIIQNNSNNGIIYSNGNTGAISSNSNSGDINNNTNVGQISYNFNRGTISYNTTNGYIQSNHNGGNITSNTQTSGSTNISFNNNNGNITGSRTGNINGTQVNL